MATNTLTVLSGLPAFTGNPRPGEPKFTPDLDARTFLRTVENYFLHNNITSDEKKLSVLFSLIDKKKGDGIRLVTCYAGKKVPFSEVKADFLDMYPMFRQSEFRSAAQALLDTKINDRDSFVSMTVLENSSRSVAESFLSNMELTKGEFGLDTMIDVPSNNSPGTIPRAPPPPPSQEASADPESSATTSRSTSHDTHPSAIAAGTQIPLVDVIQNLLMHLIISSNTNHKVYKKLQGIGPRNSSTRFMAQTVRECEKHKLLTRGNPVRQNDESIFMASSTQQQQKQKSTQQGMAKNSNLKDVLCHGCKEYGHYVKDCPNPKCPYCKKFGHKVKNCQKRIADAKGKYCAHCKIKDSHNTEECRRKKQGNIRMTQDASNEEPANNPNDNNNGYNGWDSIEYNEDEQEQRIANHY